MQTIFENDVLTKRERVERAIHLKSVDRVPIHEQLSYNPRVVGHFAGRDVSRFDYTVEDIAKAVCATLDCTFPLFKPIGTGVETSEDGFVYKLDNWTKWHLSRPFSDEHGAAQWLEKHITKLSRQLKEFDPDVERSQYRGYMDRMQSLIGDTVIMDWSITTGFCDVYDKMGLQLFSYFLDEYEDLLGEYMTVSGTLAVKKAQASGDLGISPVVLIAEDFCTTHGSIFSPVLLKKYHYPWVKELAKAWHEHGLKVIYHTDGNFKKVIPDLIACDVDGFYCLERACQMHIEDLAIEYPDLIWMGGVDGVSTMELGTTEQVAREVGQIIEKTSALQRGGIFIDTSSEINPTISLEHFLAMIQTCDKYRNPEF